MQMGPYVVKSLTFHTTKGKYGPFGEEQGPEFSSNIKGGRIVGFFGREGLFLDAIGVHIRVGETTGRSDSSDEKPKEIKKESIHSNPINQLYYRTTFRITNFWGYH